MSNLPVVEIFGPTLQGEGPGAGRLAGFVRFGGCNLSCSWCDTAYTWDASRYDLKAEIVSTPVEEILERICPEGMVVLTGGEPLLHQNNPAWKALLRGLTDREVHIETNGVLAPNLETIAGVTTFAVSPKSKNAGPHKKGQNPALNPVWLERCHDLDAHLKIVCDSVFDVDRAVAQAEAWGWPKSRVWVMPQGITKADLDDKWPVIATAAAAAGINASHRLHILAWGVARGR